MYECSLLKWSVARSFYGIWTMYGAWVKQRLCYKEHKLATLWGHMYPCLFLVSSVLLLLFIFSCPFQRLFVNVCSMSPTKKVNLVCSLMHTSHWNFNRIGPIVKYIFNPWQANWYLQHNNQFNKIQFNIFYIFYLCYIIMSLLRSSVCRRNGFWDG